MGIPGLYRWLVERYPNTICSVVEDHPPYVNGPTINTDPPNPNGVEFDNLYIDMNGIIHPCFHPEGIPPPQSYDDVFNFIFRYIDRVFAIVRPRKLLFLAVDGVAPRAKMNHQRIRRFRVAREVADKVSALEVEGTDIPENDKKLDSNVITPGTEFMDLLSAALRYYVHWRMNAGNAWRGLKVILSDSIVVGEGEDKIMSFIRSQRNLPGYDPNTRHCLHGLDADLIMLSLATHEIHVSILREIITYGRHMKMKGNRKQSYTYCMRKLLHDLKFEFFNIWVLREYLERELLPNVEGTDFDRLIDDFVFICFFVGNDFLPRLPSLDISEGGIELLLIVYQEEFVKMGYLTDSPKVNLKSMEHFLQALSSHENAIFMKRCQTLTEKRKSKRKRKVSQDSYGQPSTVELVELQSITAPNPDDADSTTSKIKIHKQYTKQGYYTRNFDCENHDIDRIRRDAVLKYTEGVCWIMHYYYQGVCSWQWFYPYHYAPFASDFCGLDKLEIDFTLGHPLKPLDQLLGVLPAASAQALPLSYRELMTKASSPILDFYPKDVKIYKNGKKHAWQGVCELPFIEESRLLSETVKVEHTLTDEERQRNRFGNDRLFVHGWHPLAKVIMKNPLSDPTSELQIQIKPEISRGMNGYLCISDEPVRPRSIPSPVNGKLNLYTNNVISVDYKRPCHPHIPKVPIGVIMPPRILRSQDSPRPPVLWHATATPSKYIVLESPSKKSQKKKKKKREQGKVEKSCLNDATEAEDHRVDEDDGKQNIVNGDSEHLIVEISRNQIEVDLSCAQQKQQISAGNGIIHDEQPQRDKQVMDGINSEHESLMKQEKKKKKKKRVRGDEVEGVEGKGHDHDDETKGEKPTNEIPDNQVKRKKHTNKRKRGGGGEEDHKSVGAADVAAEEELTNNRMTESDLAKGQQEEEINVSGEDDKKWKQEVAVERRNQQNEEEKGSNVNMNVKAATIREQEQEGGGSKIKKHKSKKQKQQQQQQE